MAVGADLVGLVDLAVAARSGTEHLAGVVEQGDVRTQAANELESRRVLVGRGGQLDGSARARGDDIGVLLQGSHEPLPDDAATTQSNPNFAFQT